MQFTSDDKPLDGTKPECDTYNWRYILHIAKEHKREVVCAQIIAILATLCSVPLPLLMPLLVDEVLLDKPAIVIATINAHTPEMWHSPSLYIGVILFFTICLRLMALCFNVIQSKQFIIIAKDITFRIRRTLLSHLEKVSMSEYEILGSGTVVTNLVTDLQTVDEFVANTISRLLLAILTVIGVALILLWVHWQLALLVLFVNPVVIYFTVIFGKHVKTLKKKENAAFEIFQRSLIETLDAIYQIRASNRERHYISRMIDQAAWVKKQGVEFSWRSDAANRLSFVVFLFGFDVFRAVAMLMVIFSDLSIGQMFAVFGYLWFMMSPVQELLNIQYSWYAAKGALERINRLSVLRLEPKYPHIKNPFLDRQTVGFSVKNVYFSYGHNNADILRNVCLDVSAGEKVALVGASGGGKSTLVKILIGLYPTRSGAIYYDSVPVSDIGLDVIREHVATVLQNPMLLNDTIRANLGMGCGFDDKVLWRALEIAQLKSMVEALPHKIDTVVGHQGIRLSGGQKQRLAIARMVLSDPEVIIMDEATSALDAETEYQLYVALSDFLENRTTLIIAHRLSAIKQANRVYVFEAGAISAQGNHQELIAQDGLYAKLYGARQLPY